MTPAELRALADVLDDKSPGWAEAQEWMWDHSIDLARLCAELWDVAETAAAFGARKRHRAAADVALTKLSELR